jgi:spore germination cell wall hydrolase CwlJ-like protein
MKGIATTMLFLFLFVQAEGKGKLSDEQCLAYTIFKEAGAEPLKAQRAVLDVMLTRMKQDNATACAVMREPHQFSFPKNNIHVTKKMLTAYRKIANMKPVASGANHFHRISVKPKWSKKMRNVKVIGKQKFGIIREK